MGCIYQSIKLGGLNLLLLFTLASTYCCSVSVTVTLTLWAQHQKFIDYIVTFDASRESLKVCKNSPGSDFFHSLKGITFGILSP